ncbi:hypothetical protein CCHR01_12686 [Colletotrichum chrysophilum]|uniref:Uncharacterized protein n=1 Tax=Colletotrichum chrysophilum TaxID=1836956 RepID=A0AAD9AAV3_9PEZI|nr:hypothetical protein CCHR01_12686 [Colletotrichum chrysophilum]
MGPSVGAVMAWHRSELALTAGESLHYPPVQPACRRGPVEDD